MNGFGPFVARLVWFDLYWAFAAALLVVAAHLLWIRGRAEGWRTRLRLARRRFRGPVRTRDRCRGGRLRRGGELDLLQHQRPQRVRARRPRSRPVRPLREEVQAVRAAAAAAHPRDVGRRRHLSRAARGRHPRALPPAQRARGSHRRRARAHRSARRDPLDRDPDRDGGDRGSTSSATTSTGWPSRSRPPRSARCASTIAVRNPGFRNGAEDTRVVRNGTFFNNYDYFPTIGYSRGGELQEPNRRREHGLPPVQRLPDLDDAEARGRNYLTGQADWMDFETTVSTSADQIALAPGYLEREWTEGGRRYFHYKMDRPILGFVAYLSGDWEVARDRWTTMGHRRGVRAVPAMLHRSRDRGLPPRKHAYNVARMIDAVKKSLDYFTAAFGPYQHRAGAHRRVPALRALRAGAAEHHPVLGVDRLHRAPRSQRPRRHRLRLLRHRARGGAPVVGAPGDRRLGAGRDRAVRDDVAVLGADGDGEGVRARADAPLPALRARPLPAQPRWRADRGAAAAARRGPGLHPLLEGQPRHVRAARRDRRGDVERGAAPLRYASPSRVAPCSRLNQEPPYTYTRELLAELRQAVPPERQGLLEDLFETITLWDNRVRVASAEPIGDGRFKVRLELDARKLRADGHGAESEIPMDDWVDVAVFGGTGAGRPETGQAAHQREAPGDRRNADSRARGRRRAAARRASIRSTS